MIEQRVVLVTGVAGYWGFRVAARLLDEVGCQVIGIDVEEPATELKELDFVQADVRNPALMDLLRAEQVDTLCHLAFVETRQPGEAAFDLNVMGTTKLLGECAEAGVSKVVLKSSTTVYGARPTNAAFLTEDHALRGSKRHGTTRDLLEIEAFCRGFRQRAPDTLLTILRFASIVGPTADTPMTRFLREPLAPTLLGFDPMMQLIHEDDVVEALVQAVVNDAPGVFNVASHDALPLNKIRGLAAKPPLSVLHPFAYWRGKLPGGLGPGLEQYRPIEPDYLRYPWVADLTRMRDELGFEPRYSAEEALRELAEQRRLGRYRTGSISLAHDEDRLHDTIERRRHAREQRAQSAPATSEGGDRDE